MFFNVQWINMFYQDTRSNATTKTPKGKHYFLRSALIRAVCLSIFHSGKFVGIECTLPYLSVKCANFVVCTVLRKPVGKSLTIIYVLMFNV